MWINEESTTSCSICQDQELEQWVRTLEPAKSYSQHPTSLWSGVGVCASLVERRVECTLLLWGYRGEDLEGSSYLPKNQSACIAFASMSRGSGMVPTQKYFECSCLLQSSGRDWEAIHRWCTLVLLFLIAVSGNVSGECEG